nr:hypothetical protein [Tanacetum cinerariifolium]
IEDWESKGDDEVESPLEIERKTVEPSMDKLADESHVLLKVPKKNNMYSVDMKNIVPTKDLTCLIAKATNDESILWHRRFTWVFFLATKDETSRILKSFITKIENLVDKKVKIIRCENEIEFKNSVMNKFCEEKGIKREYSVARTPQQNRVTERRNRTLIEAARTMVLVVKLHLKTSYELFRGRPPALSFMRPFGKAFRVYNTRTKKVEENLHINFLKNKPIITGKGASFDADSAGDNKDNDGLCKQTEIDNQERPNAEHSTKDVNIAGPSINTTTLNINTASLTLNTLRKSDDFFCADKDMRSLDGVEVNTSNISTTYPVPTTPNTRIHKDDSFDNVIGDIQSGV